MSLTLRALAVALAIGSLSSGAPAKEAPNQCVRELHAHSAAVVQQFDSNMLAARGASEEQLRTRLMLSSARQADQAMQRVLLDAMNKCKLKTDEQAFRRVMTNYGYIAKAAQAELKQILARSGWPKISKYGKEIDQAAFLIVQHADWNPAFQREVLPLLENLAAEGETARENYALLFDRVAIAENRRQRYGTQGECKGGAFELLPTEEGDLDARRESMGLDPIPIYRERMSKLVCN